MNRPVTAIIFLAPFLALAYGTSPLAMGAPGECVLPGSDCNTNGVSDLCDLEAGTSEDCNENDIPDECEMHGGGSSHRLLDLPLEISEA